MGTFSEGRGGGGGSKGASLSYQHDRLPERGGGVERDMYSV